MAETSIPPQGEWQRRRIIFLAFLLLATLILSMAALMIPFFTSQINSQLKAGEVANRDIVAPRSISYTSDLLTGLQQDAAEQSIAAIYSPPDTSIARNRSS